MTNERVVRALRAGGCVAPEREAEALLRASTAGAGSVDRLVERRLRGEPLAWVVGWAEFLGVRVAVDPGVFVPRPHTEILARRAIELLPVAGVAVDLCTGSGAVAAALLSARPAATVVATEVDPAAVACARRNGVRVLLGDLDRPLPRALQGRVDVITAVVPYVPTDELGLLPRDVVEHEPRRALDGRDAGTAVLARAAAAASGWLRPGGHALLELGGDQAAGMSSLLRGFGFDDVRILRDEDGLDRAIEGRLRSRGRSAGGPIRFALKPMHTGG